MLASKVNVTRSLENFEKALPNLSVDILDQSMLPAPGSLFGLDLLQSLSADCS